MPKTRTKALSLSNTEKLIVMSDMHRGNGTSSDDFAHNSLIYKCALSYYLENDFTYIELGDAEELWENRTFDQIYITHASIYEQLAQFHHPDPQKTRYIKIWGNHDLKWRHNPTPLEGLFPGIIIYEAALLNQHILMWHGHQADPRCLARTTTPNLPSSNGRRVRNRRCHQGNTTCPSEGLSLNKESLPRQF